MVLFIPNIAGDVRRGPVEVLLGLCTGKMWSHVLVVPLLLSSMELQSCSFGDALNLSEKNLTKVPYESIPSSVSSLRLDTNHLTYIVFPDGYMNLTVLSITENFLSEFPNLLSVSNTLQKLNLRSNQLRYINSQLLDALVELSFLNLGYNYLSHIPDVPGPGRTLHTLRLFHNDFKSIPSLRNLGQSLTAFQIGDNLINHIMLHDLLQISDVKVFGLSNLLVSHLPNLCHMPKQNSAIEVTINENRNFVCRCHFMWMKLVMPEFIEFSMDYTYCLDPEGVSLDSLQTLEASEMECQGKLEVPFMLM